MQGASMMESLIDKLCDHLPSDRIKLFIESGFDEWEIITLMKGDELIELGFSPQECIAVMVAVNAQAKQTKQQEVFDEENMKRVLTMAKEEENIRHQQIEKEQQELKRQMKEANIKEQEVNQSENQKTDKQQVRNESKQYEVPWKHEDVMQFNLKPITEAILLKGVTLRGKQKVPLSKITLMSLQQKQLTKICQMERVPQLQNLHLNHNHIYKIQNLDHLSKLRVLKLQSNELVKIEGLQNLLELEQLFLSDNHLCRFQGLTNNRKLHMVNISNQKTKKQMTFDDESCMSLSYSLQVLHCDNNRVRDISNLSYLKVLNTLNLKGNRLGDMEELSDPFGGMERLKTLDFRNNPLCSMPKYRDYIVILCKSLQELDHKKILPTERQYLVKLYSLKHAKQMREETKQVKGTSSKQIDLHVTKLQEGMGVNQYSHGADLRGNVAYANTKVCKR